MNAPPPPSDGREGFAPDAGYCGGATPPPPAFMRPPLPTPQTPRQPPRSALSIRAIRELWGAQNPVVLAEVRRLRNLGRSGQIQLYPILCLGFGCVWILFALLASADRLPSFPAPGSGARSPLSTMWLAYAAGFTGVIAYLGGLYSGFRRLRNALQLRELVEIYYTRLNPREVTVGLLVSSAAPYVLMLGLMALGLAAGFLVQIATGHGAGVPESMPTRFMNPVMQLMYFTSGSAASWADLLQCGFQLLTGTVAHIVGCVGGTLMAVRGRKRTAGQEFVSQLIYLALMACCSFGLIGVAVVGALQLRTYDAVISEFWWHAVFLPEDPDFYNQGGAVTGGRG